MTRAALLGFVAIALFVAPPALAYATPDFSVTLIITPVQATPPARGRWLDMRPMDVTPVEAAGALYSCSPITMLKLNVPGAYELQAGGVSEQYAVSGFVPTDEIFSVAASGSVALTAGAI